MNDALKSVRTRKGFAEDPQTTKTKKRQIKNSEGGHVFKVKDMDQVRRFLILGVEDGFYQPGIKLAKDNAKTLVKVIEKSPEAHKVLVDQIVTISKEGRAPKQDPGIFALAVAASHGEVEGKRYALSKLSEVARTGTTFFMFIEFVLQFRGWGRALKNGVAAWYDDKEPGKLAYQAVKYRQRNGWTHADALRVSHPESVDSDLANWILGKEFDLDAVPDVVRGFLLAKEAKNVNQVVAAISEFGLTWEMIPTEYLNEAKVWEVLLDTGNVPLGALVRQLSRLTKIGVLKPLSRHTKLVVARLGDVEEIKRARLHPLNILTAQRAYDLGYRGKTTGSFWGGVARVGSDSWTPVPAISSALDGAFRLAFQAVEPSGKNFLWAQDISGSMGVAVDSSGLTSAEAGGALALTLLNTEPNVHTVGFAHSIKEINLLKGDSVRTATQKFSGPFGSTNASAAIKYAIDNKLDVDVFVVMTDNETYGGSHVYQMKEKYDRISGKTSKLIVLAAASNEFTIGDPKKPTEYLDLASWDSAMPKLITEFSRGL